MIFLLVYFLLIALVVVIGKRLVVVIISWIIARWLRCSFVKYGHVGLFSVSDIRLCFYGFKIEIDKFWISSCFLNQEYTKPIVLCLNDIRLEPDKNSRISSVKVHNSFLLSEDKIRARIKKFSAAIQYMSGRINNLNVALFNVVFPDYLVHVVTDGIVLDTFRDRENIQLEITWKSLTCKILERHSMPGGSTIDMLQGAAITAHVNPSSYALKLLTVKCVEPVFTTSDVFLRLLQNISLVKRPVDIESTADFRYLLPFRFDLDVKNVALTFLNVSLDRRLSVNLKSFAFAADRSSQDSVLPSYNSEMDLTEFFCADGDHFHLSCLSCRLLYRASMLQPFVECYMTTVNGNSNFDLLKAWINIFHKISKDFVETKRLRNKKNEQCLNNRDGTVKTFCINLEVSSLTYSFYLPDQNQLTLKVELIEYIREDSNKSEVGIDALRLAVHPKGKKCSFDSEAGSKMHKWGRIVVLGEYLVRLEQDQEQYKIWTQIESLHVEFNIELIRSLFDVFKHLVPVQRISRNAEISDIPLTKRRLNIKTHIRDMFILLPVDNSVCYVVSSEECRSSMSLNTLSLNASKVESFRRVLNLKKLFPLTPDYCAKDLSSVPQISATFKLDCRELILTSSSEVALSWSPDLHMLLFESIKKTVIYILDFKQLFSISTSPPKLDPDEKPFSIKLTMEKLVALTFNLDLYCIKFECSTTKFYKTPSKKAVKFGLMRWIFDGNCIFTFDVLQAKKLASHPKVDEFRHSCGDELITKSNALWLTQISNMAVLFPYGYDFAGAHEELINTIRWLKDLHNLRKPSFYPGQGLPSDMMIRIENAKLEIGDDQFEVKLRDNYELLMDEQYECQQRQQILDQKIEELRKVQPILESSKVMELYASLQETNSVIYIKRSKKLYDENPNCVSLFRWSMNNIEIKALADSSYHGEENFLRNLLLMNPESESPWSVNASLNTAWCRYVSLDFAEWLMQMRDYPQPYWLMTNGHFWGRLAGAELEGTERSKRSVKVSIGSPFADHYVHRNMNPLKFYYDLGANMQVVKSAYGPCWEPCLAMINLCFEKIVRPSTDPSPPLPFWDKIRLLCHGRLSMMIEKNVMAMLASSNPYETTEQMEFTWTNFEFDWTNGAIFVISNLDVYIRTASKYDDHCLLHLPSVKLHIKMKWVCNSDNPNDHHNVSPCAPDKLPDYSVHKEHDSYRAFRSQHLNLSLSLEIKNKDDETLSDDQRPSVFLYANTFRWLDGLKNTISAVNRPVKRGPVFGIPRQKKAQLSRHYRDIVLSVSLPKFIISYWASSSNDRGAKIVSQRLALKSVHRLSMIALSKPKPCAHIDGVNQLSRRPQTTFRLISMVAELVDTEVYLFKKTLDKSINDSVDLPRLFFMSIDKLSYCRDALVRTGEHPSDAGPRHKFVASDLRASWTTSNRDVVLSILDGIQKARVLRRNLSTDALKSIPVIDESRDIKPRPRRSFTGQLNASQILDSTSVCSPPPSGHFEGNHAADMLQQLISEAATKFMAYSEETSEVPSQQLHGIVLSQMNDVLFTKWQIELINSQVLLKGRETGGYVLCTAAKAQITQRFHSPVWRENQLLGKVTWVAMLNGMQYFATVAGHHQSQTTLIPEHGQSAGHSEVDVQWLSKDVIQERTCSNQNLDVVDSLLNQGQTAGSVVGENSPSDCREQLQRIISKCDCQLYFCLFTDSADLDEIGDDVRPLEVDDDDGEFWRRKEFVDCFTLKHNMLNISTNHLQYAMIMDIVNNLILYVDPKNKQSAEKLIRYRFQLQLQSVDNLRPNITALQNDVREILSNQRFLERQMYLLNKKIAATEIESDLSHLFEVKEEIREEMERCKAELLNKSDDLAMTISCFREKQVQRHKQAQFPVNEDQQQAPIARRFEVCFEDALWRLTGDDGQIGLSDLRIRNFLYTKISRINDSGEHLLELGFLKITTLLPNSSYKDVLQPQQRNSAVLNDRMPAVRIICRELAPVGGISVKEHFEINVVPMVVQVSYAFFRTMMQYFFPDRNIDTEDQRNLDTLDDQQSLAGNEERMSSKKNKTNVKNASRKKRNKVEVEVLKDDIDKMKKRAETNNMFLYIKIPEVPFIVSYKGEKEKSIADVENFQLEIPLIEYHDRNWTWLDLSLAIKQRCKRVLLQQFMKQKLLKSRLGAAFSGSEPKLNLMNLPEEEKARMLLGTKLMGTPERSKNKSTHAQLFLSRITKM